MIELTKQIIEEYRQSIRMNEYDFYKKRKPELGIYRYTLYYVLYRNYNFRYVDIAKTFNTHHASIRHNISNIIEHLEIRDEYCAIVQEIIKDFDIIADNKIIRQKAIKSNPDKPTKFIPYRADFRKKYKAIKQLKENFGTINYGKYTITQINQLNEVIKEFKKWTE